MSDLSTTPSLASTSQASPVVPRSADDGVVAVDRPPADPSGPPATFELNARGLVVSTLLGIAVLAAAIGVVGYWFRAPLLALSQWFVATTGGPGVALGFYLPDAFTLPIPNDAFGMFGLAGGMGFWEVVAWGSLGSLLGGTTGWTLGGLIRNTRWLERFLTGRGARFAALIRRYGVLVVAIAAITPLPYSLSAWAAGAVQMPFATFLTVSLLRVFRVAGALYLIDLGLAGTM